MYNYKLAVIIPCWNCGKVVAEMLDSILEQSFHDWKVFCIDDKSTDDTSTIIDIYTQKDERIKYIERNREPKGAQTCRNVGFDLSEGAEYVIWFDCDDIIAPYCFEQRVSYMDSNLDLDFGIFKAKTFLDGTDMKAGGSLYGYEFSGYDDVSRFFRHTQPYAGWANIYRRDSIIRFQLSWDENILSLQDSDFCIQSLLKGMKGGYCSNARVDYFWRINQPKSTITKNIKSDAHKMSHIYYLNKLYNSFNDKQRKKYALEWDDYLFYFIDMFYTDNEFIETILNQEWMRERKWLGYRIRLYCKSNKRCKPFLFPIIANYKRFYSLEWKHLRKQQLQLALQELAK